MRIILHNNKPGLAGWRLCDGHDVLESDLRAFAKMLAEDAVDFWFLHGRVLTGATHDSDGCLSWRPLYDLIRFHIVDQSERMRRVHARELRTYRRPPFNAIHTLIIKQ